MTPRGAERPDDDADLGNEQAGGRKGRRFGRGRPEPVEPVILPQEETGWLDDLRTAKQQRSAIGPGTLAGETRYSKSGRVAPGPDDEPDDDFAFPAIGDSGDDPATPPARRPAGPAAG
ncbi:hypothetical protein AB0J83_34425, partial [Actinoplanes sp. NPDC049596]|uniref:hypothetical protein n=1 Tax=Actinoplanes sp. NPDC049596 TaxID=3154625 RepID=UPI003449A7A7